jgi:hypothetical protein
MNADQERRLSPAFDAVAERLVEWRGSRRPPSRQAKLATFLVLMWRKEQPVWPRRMLAQAAGYASKDGVDKAVQALIESRLFIPKIRTAPGSNAKGPSIRRLRYLVPNPELFSLVCSTVRWRV